MPGKIGITGSIFGWNNVKEHHQNSFSKNQLRPPEDMIQDRVKELASLPEFGDLPKVFEIFDALHPVDQGEVLTAYPVR
ncbi:MAG: hypothetical protein CM1200mP22_13800 [Dehalococcoidia bacterium]|nr:MAG: hypothetical protein CM1200mP22_13800 [Dehalococcoidia bacterium]